MYAKLKFPCPRFEGMTFQDGTDRLPRTSVRNYHYSLRNNPEERSSRLFRGGSPKSRPDERELSNSRSGSLSTRKFVSHM